MGQLFFLEECFVLLLRIWKLFQMECLTLKFSFSRSSSDCHLIGGIFIPHDVILCDKDQGF